MAERTHEFISAGSDIDPISPVFPFRQSYGYGRAGRLFHRPITSSISEDEPHPGMDEVEGAYYDAAQDPREEKIKRCGEYGSHNYRFWVFMFAALAISVLMFVAIHVGSRDVEYKLLKLPAFSPIPEFVIAGFVAFYFITAFVAYHSWKEKNGSTYRNGSLFLMLVVWALTLWWAVLFYGQHSENDASVALYGAIIALIIWTSLVLCRSKYDREKSYLLILGLAWLAYLLYFNVGTINNLPCKKGDILPQCECFGDKGTRINRFERFRRHTII